MARYEKNGSAYNGRFIEVNGMKLLSPSESVLLANGWERVTQEPTEEEVAEIQRAARAKELHILLESTDYKVIKNSECQMLGLPLPYDPADVHAEKQAWRDELNELEGEKVNRYVDD